MWNRVGKRYLDAELDKFQLKTQEHQRLISYLKSCLENGFKNNIIISGDVGTGKTYIAFALIIKDSKAIKIINNDSIINSDNFYYTTVGDLLLTIKNNYYGKINESYMGHEKNAPVLIIDEIGRQKANDEERLDLFKIIDYRYNEMLPIIAISNKKKKDLLNLLGKGIYDRLFSNAEYFELNCESNRNAS